VKRPPALRAAAFGRNKPTEIPSQSAKASRRRTRPHVLWWRSAGGPARGRLARMPGGLWPLEGGGDQERTKTSEIRGERAAEHNRRPCSSQPSSRVSLM
jgi:hypothetical protein